MWMFNFYTLYFGASSLDFGASSLDFPPLQTYADTKVLRE